MTTAAAFTHVAAETDVGLRLDTFIASLHAELSRAAVQRLIVVGAVLLNGRPADKAGVRLTSGDIVEVRMPPSRPARMEAEPIPLRIVYEDADLLVIDKPPGIAVHPAPGHEHGTLVNAVLSLRPGIAGVGGELRPGIVHRLDKDTSGLIIIALHDAAHRDLAAQLKDRAVSKTYLALVDGRLSRSDATIDAPLGRDPHHRKRMAVVSNGRDARTRYIVLEQFDSAALVEAHPETGRTHQIRVHFAAIGHPILGDALYGRPSPLIARQALHAWRLRFRSPSTGETITLEAPPPPDFQEALARLRAGVR